MMTGADTATIGLWHEVVELYCPDCACKVIGTVRAERIRLGLSESWEWKPAYQWQADDQAEGWREEIPDPEFEMLCCECGTRLDTLSEICRV